MRSHKLKIIVALLAGLLCIGVVWSNGGFSYLASLFERNAVVSEDSTQAGDDSSQSNSGKNEGVNTPKLTYPFKEYPATEIYKGKFAPLKLTREEKKSVFGEKLQYTMENDPEVDFAGHYIVAIESCGMWCQWSAIIDAKTGKVYSWDGNLSLCFPDFDTDFACNEEFSSVEYRIDSKLIVFFGSLSYGKDRGFHYYRFEKGRFIHLKSRLVNEQRSTSEITLDLHDEKTDKNKIP